MVRVFFDISMGKLIFSASSAIIRDLEQMSKLGLATMTFFFFDSRNKEKQTLRGLLSSALIQLCDQSDFYYDVLSKLHSKHGGGSRYPSDDALKECLEGMINSQGQPPVYIVVDAIDECQGAVGMPSAREKVLNLVKELIDLPHENLRVCVTSRPEPDIYDILSPIPYHSVSLHDEEGQRQDIVNYVKDVVNAYSEKDGWTRDDKNMVIDIVSRGADGM